MDQLPNMAKRLLEAIAHRLRSGAIRADDPRTYPTYGEVHDELNLPLQGSNVGVSLNRQALTPLAQFMQKNRLPAITALVVNKETLLPGRGFFELYGHKNDDFGWWQAEATIAANYDWSPWVQKVTEQQEAASPAAHWRSRIQIDPAIHHGDPCIVGTRVPVKTIVNCIANGDTVDDILKGWPQLHREDVQAALQFAAEAVSTFDYIPFAPQDAA